MGLKLEAVQGELDEFGEWLDANFAGRPGYYTAPARSQACSNYGCSERRLKLGRQADRVSRRAKSLDPGENAESVELTTFLISHNVDCRKLVIASLVAHSEFARGWNREEGYVAKVNLSEQKMKLGCAGANYALRADYSSNTIEVSHYSPDGIDRDGKFHSRTSFPQQNSGEVREFVNEMHEQILDALERAA